MKPLNPTYNRKKKTVFNPALPTPTWAKWMFRVTFALTTGICAYLQVSEIVPEHIADEIMNILKLVVDPAIYALSKCFGLKERE